MSGHEHEPVEQAPGEFWEQRYSEAGQIWSGRVNGALIGIVGGLEPAASLDLGCGEGGDVLWLAERGWDALGIDLSPTAVARGRAEASARGLEHARFVAADLAEWVARPEAIDGSPCGFTLITASFLQSPVELPREVILRRALDRLVPGGRLVIVAHAAPPPWAKGFAHAPGAFPSPASELSMLGLGDAEGVDPPAGGFTVEVAEIRRREATGPAGEHAELADSVIVIRRDTAA